MARKNPLAFNCPECGSKNLRPSLQLNFGEKILDLLGFQTVRCTDCSHRWTQSLWRIHELFYARCPRCYRLELVKWEETYYHISNWWKFQIAIGAKKVRCKPCRHNFVSFRIVKGVRKWVNEDPSEVPVVETSIRLSDIEKPSEPLAKS
jgi:DNA-directed RNA polymerase subunit RPC12/RpoP